MANVPASDFALTVVLTSLFSFACGFTVHWLMTKLDRP